MGNKDLLNEALMIVDAAEFSSDNGMVLLSNFARGAVVRAFENGMKEARTNVKGQKIYIACYSRTYYVDYEQVVVFATFIKYRAQKWVKKFNSMLKKWTEFYSDSLNKNRPYALHRSYQLMVLSEAYIMEVELR